VRVATVDRTKEWTVEDYLFTGGNENSLSVNKWRINYSLSPGSLHQRVLRDLFRILDKNVIGKGEVFFAPMDLYINEKNVFQPDLIYLSNKNKNFISERCIEGPPDIIIEIISPSNQKKKRLSTIWCN
jgi:Uma2 family endonuclease